MDRYNVKVSAETKLTNNFTTGFAGNYITTSIDKAVTSGNGLLRTVYASPASYDLAGIPSHVDGDIYKQNSFRGNLTMPIGLLTTTNTQKTPTVSSEMYMPLIKQISERPTIN